MGKYNFSKYFDKKGQKYYDPKIMITILSDILGKNIDELKRDLANFKVTVTREQIIQYLERKFEEENPDVKERIESKNYQNLSNNLTDWPDVDVALYLQKSEDRGIASKYAFSPHLFNYFNKYSNITF